MVRRTLLLASVVALLAPAAASANAGNLLDVFRQLDLHSLSPPPLVPVTVPPRLRPVEASLGITPTVHRSAYGWLLRHYRAGGSDAIIAFSGGDFRTMRAVKRNFRDAGRTAIRVRGRRGLLFTRRAHPV